MSKNYPSPDQVIITDTWSNPALYGRVNSAKRYTTNQTLPPNSRGVFIGASGYYNLFVEGTDGSITPFMDIAGGVVHPICPISIVDTDTYNTTATNLIVLY